MSVPMPSMVPPPPRPEDRARVKEALETAAGILEKGRCLETELEATAMLSKSLMKHPPDMESSVDVSNLPGGVRDAWCVISDASNKRGDEVAAAAAVPIESMPDVTKKENELPLGRGQLGKAVHTTALADSIKKGNALAKEVKDQRQKEGTSLKRALNEAKSVPGYDDLWLQIFDEKLQQLQMYHARHAVREESVINKRRKLGNPASDGYDLASSAAEAVAPLQQGTLFNEEEVMGKYLDLQQVYDLSGSHVKKLAGVSESQVFPLSDMVALLAKGPLSETITEADKLKQRKHYIRFLTSLQENLQGFIKKVSPLLPIEEVVKPAEEDLLKQWRSTGGADGWEAKSTEAHRAEVPTDGDASSSGQTPPGIDLAPYASAADLEEAVDGDKLKAELARLGLKCGGTPADRARRLFMTKDTPLDKLPKKLFAKTKARSNGATDTDVAVKTERRVDVAKREKVVMALLDHVRPTLEATLRRLERQQTQTVNEREQELDEELHGSAIEEDKKLKTGDEDSDDEEEDAPIYNPKGVPLGWDGKPIPYWLFKLHGLNHFYPCEICGNESYRGRRNFELHFTEAKHAYGMKCLGIPNSRHFHGVVKIEDALSLWKKLQGQLDEGKAKDEEYEDSHGNVLSRQAYEDLARQGLL